MTSQRYRNIYLDGHVHFCTTSVLGFIPLFIDEGAVRVVFGEWDRCRRQYEVKILAYVVMPEHIHILLWAAEGESIMRFLQQSGRRIALAIKHALESSPDDGCRRTLLRLKRGSARGDSMQVWQERPRVLPITSRAIVLQKIDYIHRNPVRRELVAAEDTWPWSSVHWIHGEGNTGGLVPDPIDLI